MDINTFNSITIIIGFITILVNIGIAIYNIGKNRIIYDVKEIIINTGAGKGCFDKLRSELNKGEFTILTSYLDPGDSRHHTKVYVLGKVRKRKFLFF